VPNSDSLRILTRSFLQEVRNPFQRSLCDELAHALSKNAIYLKILDMGAFKVCRGFIFALSSTPRSNFDTMGALVSTLFRFSVLNPNIYKNVCGVMTAFNSG
jgi:hypothetical protein